MPKDPRIKSVLLIGSGPIVIGQACEFDYSGVQACQALKEEGCRVILINSNPATIMTDPEVADVTYLEPLTARALELIIKKEKPDTVLPTMGGQTALNTVLIHEQLFKRYGVKLIGAQLDTIKKAEDRALFSQSMNKIGLKTPPAAVANNIQEALAVSEELGFPSIVRPSFTLGGSGGGIAYNTEEFIAICHQGFQLSPLHQLQIDKSLLGWKEYELEVVRDKADNCIIVCSIENVDPMGIHTGDSITVAPCQTLTDKEYQQMRDAAISVLKIIGVETGGANVQFAVNPRSGEQIVVEMNPRVSRSSALASKATGFPIARIAAKLALGYSLDELRNEITGNAIPASFEPTLDYVVTKIPRFDFEKFSPVQDRLTTQMKSVGEVMAIGRHFNESLQKALCSLEIGLCGLNPKLIKEENKDETLTRELKSAGPDRLLYIADAFRQGWSRDKIYQLTDIDPWFLVHIEQIIHLEEEISTQKLDKIDNKQLFKYKQQGFSDMRLAQLLGTTEDRVRKRRHKLAIHPVYKRVDSCAAEFDTPTAYLYSSYDDECEADPQPVPKVIILGSGPNRIGQGIEFDYCCVHSTQAVHELGYQTIMVNCNPETVSTDYDMSDKLYFEPLTLEHSLEIILREQPKGVLVQYGGQTPLKLATPLSSLGVQLLGASATDIHRVEDREEFRKIINKLKLRQPKNITVTSLQAAQQAAAQIGYPIVVRPSYVLGGRAMKTVFNDRELSKYLSSAITVAGNSPVLLDSFLDSAIEVDVDAVSDGQDTFIGGIMQHIEQAGIHSGDSSCCVPPHSLPPAIKKELCTQTALLASHLRVKGLLNIQYAIQGKDVYVLEINPRASRTTPFISKAIAISLPKLAASVALGKTLKELLGPRLKHTAPIHSFYAVKESVFPFHKFPGTDPILGPEMKSTGEVMGIGKDFVEAFYKASLAAGTNLTDLQDKKEARAFISVRDKDKEKVIPMAQKLLNLGFQVIATTGTAAVLSKHRVKHETVNKVYEGSPHIVDMIKNNEIDFIINTTEGERSVADSMGIRTEALINNLCYSTTLAAAEALILAIEKGNIHDVYSLQQYFAVKH